MARAVREGESEGTRGGEQMAALLEDGRLGEVKKVAGGGGESVTSPAFDPLGQLYFVSDRSVRLRPP